MKNFKRILVMLLAFTFAMEASSQTQTWREMHKVKKKETIYGISKEYGITEQELRDANPEMKNEGYMLKKGDYIFIPYPKVQTEEPKSTVLVDKNTDIRERAIRLGVMLPLHNENGDGRRMVEYYRGVLMAIEDLKTEGISVDVHAWNMSEDANVSMMLLEDGVSDCDIIFGPLYTRQMDQLSQFTKAYGVKLVIPFSISGEHVRENANIFQVYQPQSELDAMAITNFLSRFQGYNYVIVDCNDENSTKGAFTSALRARMEESKLNYNITNLTSSEQTFARAFSLDKPNVVVLNTARSPQLNEAFRKLNTLTAANKNIQVSMFGYNEWLMYEKTYMELFYKYDTYIPTFYYYNTGSTRIKNLEDRYKERFGAEMMAAIPRFAITGYDQARFFLRGLHRDGKTFTGEISDKDALQTQFKFSRVGENGGLKNHQFLFMHYNRNRTISTVVY